MLSSSSALSVSSRLAVFFCHMYFRRNTQRVFFYEMHRSRQVHQQTEISKKRKNPTSRTNNPSFSTGNGPTGKTGKAKSLSLYSIPQVLPKIIFVFYGPPSSSFFPNSTKAKSIWYSTTTKKKKKKKRDTPLKKHFLFLFFPSFSVIYLSRALMASSESSCIC